MKGKFNLMKRWFVAIFVLALGLSLTSCSGGKKSNLSSDVFECDSDYWSLYVKIEAGSETQYTLLIKPVDVTASQYGGAASGDIALGTPDETPDVVASQVSLIPGRIIRIPVSDEQLYYFSLLIIHPHVPGVAFEDVSRDETVVCELPYMFEDTE